MKKQWHLEVTDTFCGEANYSWATRWTLPGKLTERGVVRALKREMGITGERADVLDAGDITVRPVGRDAPCVIGFADLREVEE